MAEIPKRPLLILPSPGDPGEREGRKNTIQAKVLAQGIETAIDFNLPGRTASAYAVRLPTPPVQFWSPDRIQHVFKGYLGVINKRFLAKIYGLARSCFRK